MPMDKKTTHNNLAELSCCYFDEADQKEWDDYLLRPFRDQAAIMLNVGLFVRMAGRNGSPYPGSPSVMKMAVVSDIERVSMTLQNAS